MGLRIASARRFSKPTEPRPEPVLARSEPAQDGRCCPHKELAREMNISPETVHFHMKQIFNKLEVHDRGEAQYKRGLRGGTDDQLCLRLKHKRCQGGEKYSTHFG
jgi:hypothetical protein